MPGRKPKEPQAWSRSLLLVCIALLASGCSISKAVRQPDKKDMSLLNPGVPRSQIIAEFGSPKYQETIDGNTRDVYAFTQGYTDSVKAARAVGHGFADFATFGLWELAGYPIELVLDGEEVQVMLAYDPKLTVTEVTYFKGAHLRENGPTLPLEMYSSPLQGGNEVVRITKGPDGALQVATGLRPESPPADETRVAESIPTSAKVLEVNEATYNSSSGDGRHLLTGHSATKLR